MRNMLMLVALLVATVAFASDQKENNPPSSPGVAVPAPGPDGFGYVVSDAYTFSLLDISTTGVNQGTGDDATLGPVVLALPFNFYGTVQGNVWLQTNGGVTFLDQYMNLSNVCPLPDTETGIELYNDDLVVDGGIYTEYFEVCPQQGRDNDEPCTIIMWDDTRHYGSTVPYFEMELILFHRTGDIAYVYGDVVEYGSGATVGLEDGSVDPNFCITIVCDTPNSVPANSSFFVLHPNPVPTDKVSFGALKAMYK